MPRCHRAARNGGSLVRLPRGEIGLALSSAREICVLDSASGNRVDARASRALPIPIARDELRRIMGLVGRNPKAVAIVVYVEAGIARKWIRFINHRRIERAHEHHALPG